jgi:hypothetical protein
MDFEESRKEADLKPANRVSTVPVEHRRELEASTGISLE